MSNNFTVLVDDNLLTYSGSSSSQWQTGRGNSDLFINGSTHDASAESLSFTYSFHGNTFSWTGVLWETEDIEFSISVDGGSTSTCTAQDGDEDLNVYKALCRTSGLSNGQHTVQVTCREQDEDSPVSIDYVTYTVQSNDAVPEGVSPGMFILVDDGDSALTYDGTWTTDSSTYFADGFTRQPHGGSTHRSTIGGSKLTYTFSGTSVTVYGVEIVNTGSLLATLQIDGSDKGNVSVSGQSSNGGRANKALVSASGLSANEHEMVLILNQVSENQALVVDYILYEPLYDSESGNGNGTTPGGDDSGGSKSNAWIAGPIIGALVGLLLSGLAYWWWKRKHRHRGPFEIEDPAQSKNPSPPFQYASVPTTEPANPPPAVVSLNSIGPSLLARGGAGDHSSQSAAPQSSLNPWEIPATNGNRRHSETPSRTPSDTSYGSSAPIMSTANIRHDHDRAIPDAPPPVPAKGKGNEDDISPQTSQAVMLEKARAGMSSPPSSFPVAAISSQRAIASQGRKMQELESIQSQGSKFEELSQSSRRSLSLERGTTLSSVDTAPASPGSEDVGELIRRNEMLEQEVARLSGMPPPAYEPPH